MSAEVQEHGVREKEASTLTSPEVVNDDLSIVLPPPAGFPAQEPEEPEMDTFDVTLVKDHQGLGITIAGYVCEKGLHANSLPPLSLHP